MLTGHSWKIRRLYRVPIQDCSCVLLRNSLLRELPDPKGMLRGPSRVAGLRFQRCCFSPGRCDVEVLPQSNKTYGRARSTIAYNDRPTVNRHLRTIRYIILNFRTQGAPSLGKGQLKNPLVPSKCDPALSWSPFQKPKGYLRNGFDMVLSIFFPTPYIRLHNFSIVGQ